MPSIQQIQNLLDRSPGDPFLLYGLAQAYAAAGDHPRAIDHYALSLAADPDAPYTHYHLARSLAALNRSAEARAALASGRAAAHRARDAHAAAEIEALLDELSDDPADGLAASPPGGPSA